MVGILGTPRSGRNGARALAAAFFAAALACGGAHGKARAQSAYQQAVDMAGGAPDMSRIPEPQMSIERADGDREEPRSWAREDWTPPPEAPSPRAAARRAAATRVRPPPPPSREEVELAQARGGLEAAKARRETARAALAKERNELDSEKRALAQKSARVEALRRDAERAARDALEAKRDCDAAFAAADPAVFDDRALYRPLLGRIVDAGIHRRALKEVERLRALSRELEKRLELIRASRDAAGKELAEFEKLRAESLWGAASSVVSVLAVSDVIAEHKGLDPEKIARLRAGLAALSSLVASGESFSAPSSRERWSKIADAADGLVELLGEAGKLPIPPTKKKVFENVQKVATGLRKLGEYIYERGERGQPILPKEVVSETTDACIQCALDIGGTFWTPARVIQGAYGLLEAGLTHWATADVVRELRATRASSWSAERHILEKKREIEERIRELEMTAIQPYREAEKLGRE